jgi:hypothetical protein
LITDKAGNIYGATRNFNKWNAVYLKVKVKSK